MCCDEPCVIIPSLSPSFTARNQHEQSQLQMRSDDQLGINLIMNSMIEELMQIKSAIGESQLLGPGNPNSVLYFLSIAVSYTTLNSRGCAVIVVRKNGYQLRLF